MMNKRIEMLANKAGFEYIEADGIGWAGNYNASLPKFAELIIKECAKFLEENSGYDNCNNAWHPEPEDLLEHFGVTDE